MYTENDVIEANEGNVGDDTVEVELTFIDDIGEQYCYAIDVAVYIDHYDYNMREAVVYGLKVYGTGAILEGVDLTELTNHCDLERLEADILDSNA